MVERFTDEARQVVKCAQEQARRLGHGFIGCEHLLYGLANVKGEVGDILREQGVTPQRYEAQFIRIIGAGSGAGHGAADASFGAASGSASFAAYEAASEAALDKDALTAIGIDLDAVRERVEAVFGPGALTAAQAPPSRRRAPWRRGPRRRRPRTVTGHLPVTRRVKRCLESSRRQARELGGGDLGAGHIALALLAMDEGLPPRILETMGASSTRLRAEIFERCYRTAL
ncbi:MAG TPA: Clp protease N-terminal domain-containing protein [Actinospica sp.]|nr:Clp protease N-terminal domain-containing protein [Actinospica sp.]